MSQPLLNVKKTHACINEFNGFGVTKRMIFEVKNRSIFSFNLTGGTFLLEELKLNLSEEKTLITHTRDSAAKFLVLLW